MFNRRMLRYLRGPVVSYPAVAKINGRCGIDRPVLDRSYGRYIVSKTRDSVSTEAHIVFEGALQHRCCYANGLGDRCDYFVHFN